MTEISSVDERYAALLRALRKMPRHTGVTLRGHREPAALYYPGRAIVTERLTATTTQLPLATQNGAVRTIFAVVGDAGAAVWHVAAEPLEREVTYLPFTLFVVGATEPVGGYQVTFVEQADPDRTPELRSRLSVEWAREAVRRMIEIGATEPDLHPVSPEKFVGPIA